jgi:DNA-binding transcriptional MerR regulator
VQAALHKEGELIVQNKFSIGQMARLHNIPVKTLRYYDEIGLFEPYEVDPQTGYRYYTLEQFKKLDIIVYLKMMGVPLKEIKRKMEHSSLDEFIETLAEYQQVTKEKIRHLQRVNAQLTTRMKELEQTRHINQIGAPFIKHLSSREVVQVKAEVGTLDGTESVLRDLKKKISHITPIMIGKVGFMLSVENTKKQQFTDYDGIFLLVESDVSFKHELVTLIPEGDYASIYMREKRDTTGVYYDALLNFIKAEGYKAEGPFLIRRIVDSFISHHEEERLTEIQIRITS